jgi:hypothetical protein
MISRGYTSNVGLAELALGKIQFADRLTDRLARQNGAESVCVEKSRWLIDKVSLISKDDYSDSCVGQP